jgi:hypothetical protein
MKTLSTTVQALNAINVVAASFLARVLPSMETLVATKVYNANDTFSAKWKEKIEVSEKAIFAVVADKLVLVVAIEIDGDSFSRSFNIGKIHKATGLLISIKPIEVAEFDPFTEEDLAKKIAEVQKAKAAYENLLSGIAKCARFLINEKE